MRAARLLSVMLSAVSILVAGTAQAQIQPGEWDRELKAKYFSLKDGDIEFSLNARPFFRYKVFTLMGEPVEVSEMAWCLPDASAFCTWRPKYWRPFGKPSIVEQIPAAVLRKIKMYNVTVTGFLLTSRAGSWIAPTSGAGKELFMAFDPGALSAPFMGEESRFLGLGDAEKEKTYSFNVPGSPDWGKTFRVWDGRSGSVLVGPARYEGSERARSIMMSGFWLEDVRVEAASFDFSAVKDWIAATRAAALGQEKSRFEREERDASGAEERARAGKDSVGETQARERKAHASAELARVSGEERGLQAEQNVIAQEQQESVRLLEEEKRRVQSRSVRGSAAIAGSLLFLIDTSGSMSGSRIEAAKDAAVKSARDALKQNAEVAVLAFSGSCGSPITRRLEFSRDEKAVTAFISSLSADGGTPMSSALRAANEYMLKAGSRSSSTRLIILLADGDDSCGGLEKVLAEIGKQSVAVRYETIGLEIGEGAGADQLRSIARATGGSYHYASNPGELARTFEAAMDAMNMMKMFGTFGSGGAPASTPAQAASPAPGSSSSGSMKSILDTFD